MWIYIGIYSWISKNVNIILASQSIQLMGYFPDIAAIISGFDLGSCQVAYDPSKGRCYATPRGKFSLEFRTNLLTIHDDRLDIFRVRKYFLRGIGVAMPSSCHAVHANREKVWAKRDRYLFGVIKAYQSRNEGEIILGRNRRSRPHDGVAQYGPDRDGMQRRGSPERDDDPHRSASGYTDPPYESLPPLPEIYSAQLEQRFDKNLNQTWLGRQRREAPPSSPDRWDVLHGPFDFGDAENLDAVNDADGFPPVDRVLAMNKWKFKSDEGQTDLQNQTQKERYEREFRTWYAAWKRQQIALRDAKEAYEKQRLPIIAQNLDPTQDLADLTKSYYREYVDSTTVLERLVNLIRETDLRATGESGTPFEDRIQVLREQNLQARHMQSRH